MASAPISSLTEVRALARLHPIPKSPVPALYWDGPVPTMMQYAYDIGSYALLGVAEHECGQWHALSCQPDPEALDGLRWTILGVFITAQQARSALEADVARRASLIN